MDRRELLKRSAALACVAAVPNLLDLPFCLPLSAETSGVAWPETTASLAHRNAMMPLLEKLNTDRRVTTLTPDEYDQLAIHHQFWHGMHFDLGHFRALDVAIRGKETYLKSRYNPTRVDEVIRYGSFAIVARGSTAMHQAATKLRLQRYGSQIIQDGHLVEAQYLVGCANFFEDISLLYDALALALFIPGPGELIIMFGLMAMLTNILGQYMCSS